MRSLRTTIVRIAQLLEPKSHVVGLGRWKSSYPEEKKNSQWFHDMCSQDNCFTNATFLKRTYISAPPLPPPPGAPYGAASAPPLPSHLGAPPPLLDPAAAMNKPPAAYPAPHAAPHAAPPAAADKSFARFRYPFPSTVVAAHDSP